MKVLGLGGSPRIGGNTDILLDYALSGAKNKGAQIEKIILNQLNIFPCQECENTQFDLLCLINDDMQTIYPKVKEADALILASPIFFGSLSAQTKMMIDRFQCLWMAKQLSKGSWVNWKRPGAFISVQASLRQDSFDNARSIVKNFFATIDLVYQEELLWTGVDKKAGILAYPEGLKDALQLGGRLVSKKPHPHGAADEQL